MARRGKKSPSKKPKEKDRQADGQAAPDTAAAEAEEAAGRERLAASGEAKSPPKKPRKKSPSKKPKRRARPAAPDADAVEPEEAAESEQLSGSGKAKSASKKPSKKSASEKPRKKSRSRRPSKKSPSKKPSGKDPSKKPKKKPRQAAPEADAGETEDAARSERLAASDKAKSASKRPRKKSRSKKPKKKAGQAAPDALEGETEEVAAGERPVADAGEDEATEAETPPAAETVVDLDTSVDEVEVFDLDADLARPTVAFATVEEPAVPSVDEATVDVPDADTVTRSPIEVDEAPGHEPRAPATEARRDDADAEQSGTAGGPEADAPTGEDAATAPPGDPQESAEEADHAEALIDPGETSTPEARARLLAETMAHAEMQEARYRVPTPTGQGRHLKTAVALVLFTLAGLLAIAPPSLLLPTPPAQLDTNDRQRGILLALLLQAEQIEAYRAREGRLPTSLDEVTARLPGVQYVRSSNRLYQLVAYTSEGRAVIYDSASPAPDFDGLGPAWHPSAGSS